MYWQYGRRQLAQIIMTIRLYHSIGAFPQYASWPVRLVNRKLNFSQFSPESILYFILHLPLIASGGFFRSPVS